MGKPPGLAGVLSISGGMAPMRTALATRLGPGRPRDRATPPPLVERPTCAAPVAVGSGGPGCADRGCRWRHRFTRESKVERLAEECENRLLRVGEVLARDAEGWQQKRTTEITEEIVGDAPSVFSPFSL